MADDKKKDAFGQSSFPQGQFVNPMFNILYPFPVDGMTRFKEGDKVRLKIRPALKEMGITHILHIPDGAEGIVKQVHREEGGAASQGRPYYVEFDLRPFNIPHTEDERRIVKEKLGIDLPEFMIAVSTDMHPDDLELVE